MNDLIAGYARHLVAGTRSPITIRDRVRILERIDADLPCGLQEATVEELQDWLIGPLARDGQPKWSAKTRLTYYECVTAFYAWATDPRHPKLSFDPSASLDRPTWHRGAPDPVSEEEFAYILDHAEGFWKWAALLAGFEGFRCAEIAGAEREHFTRDYVTVTGKGNKQVALPLHPLVWEAVRDFPRGSIARHLIGREVSPDYLSQAFPKQMFKLGLMDVHLHRLRARFATIMLIPKEHGGGGWDLRTVQELMRHSSPTITAQYTQVTDGQRRLAIATLPVPKNPPSC